jgi:hypothetical protein
VYLTNWRSGIAGYSVLEGVSRTGMRPCAP